MTSSELTGGAGFTYEDAVVAYYLGALLAGTTATGLGGRIVQRVAQQQASFGEPLDDAVVDATSPDGESPMRLSLQVKRSLTISDASSNSDFREVILRSLETLGNPGFREGIDRVGAAVDTISDEAYRRFANICEAARSSAHASAFSERFAPGGNASVKDREMVAAVRSIASQGDSNALSEEQLFRLWSHSIIIKFDGLHEGATREADVIAVLQHVLVSSQVGRAKELWQQLRQLARDGAGRSTVFSRALVLRQLAPGFRFVGTPALAGDLAVLRESTDLWLAQQPSDIGGQHIDRAARREQLTDQIDAHRLTIIKGLPGSGKTVLMRDLVAQHAALGPTLLLTANRLSGGSWIAYARAGGLTSAPIESLLTEIGATGIAILFIDGLDRIAPEHRAIVTDVLGRILSSDELASWRIVATARDAGIEPLRNWVPRALLSEGGVGYVDVGNLDEAEASTLAERIPALKPLLMGGDERVRDLARRPFFAAVMARGLSSAAYPADFAPTSEVDLIDAWWQRGGYDAAAGQTLARQRALIELAQRSAPDLGRNLRLGQLSSATATTFPALEQDGLVQQVRRGHTAQFSHDIFFEWSFYHLLLDQGQDWIRALTEAGEPPALARVVELLSQAIYSDAAEWQGSLGLLQQADLRPQWLRAWLMAPVFSADFAEHLADYRSVLVANECRLLAKLLVWIQAEKTTPNPLVLSGQWGDSDMQAAARIRLADALGWPSDFPAWRRLILWVTDDIDIVADSSLPDVVRIFEAWQMFATDYANPVSQRIVELTATWLDAIEDEEQSPSWRQPQRDALGATSPARVRIPASLATELRGLLIRATRSYPALVTAYLAKVASLARPSRGAFNDVMGYAPLLSKTHPELLAAVARKALLTELPDETKARWRAEAQARSQRQAEILAKPEEEHNRHDQLSLSSAMLGNEFSYHDWDRLAIGGEHEGYFPASPLREPFHSLLRHSHHVGLRLIRDMANHAATAWVQLHHHIWESGTPRPLTLEFPWGKQQFWGASRHYVWFRGHGGPQAVECAMMALESWALEQLDGGRNVDELLQELLEGQSSIAILGIAVHIALRGQHASPTTLPLIASQRLWHLDIQRMVQESELHQASLMGFRPQRAEGQHREAVIRADLLDSRRLELRNLVPLFVLSESDAIRLSSREALERFPDMLEFDYEEESLDPRRVSELRRTAELWAEWGRSENYVATRVPGREDVLELQVRSPRHSDPDVQQAAEQYKQVNAEAKLWLWVNACFEAKKWADGFTLNEAIEYAKNVAATCESTEKGLATIANGAIAGTAAAIYCFTDTREEDEWSKATIEAYRDAAEDPDLFPGAIVSWHPKIFVARALAARVSSGEAGLADRGDLLRLVVHPLECVSLAAIESLSSCWDTDARFVWCGFNLALRMTRYVHHAGSAARDEQSVREMEEQYRDDALAETIREFEDAGGLPAWVVPHPSWARTLPGGRRQGYGDPAGWRRTDDYWRSDYAAKFLPLLPAASVMASPAGTLYIDAIEALLLWTLDTLSPDWRSERRQGAEYSHDGMYAWQMVLGKLVAEVSMQVPAADAVANFLEPLTAQCDETSMSLLRPFIAYLAAAEIMDPPVISTKALEFLDVALDRTLQHRDLSRRRNDRGRLGGFDLPEIIKSLFFVAVDRADGASRFANGQWGDLPAVMPLIDKLVRHAGWIPYVMQQFLILCERAGEDYPVESFANQAMAQMENGQLPAIWKVTASPASIAGVVQARADQLHPLPGDLARKLLRILDALVDLGDRRSAALQLGESFRGVRLGAAN